MQGRRAACSARAAPSRSRLPFVTECNKRVSKRQTVRPLKVAEAHSAVPATVAAFFH